ncbi:MULTISPECIES: hypothetical protein [Acidithiobacillus]|jgi:hypothetical protein|uniref:hypothetical protein n=1 Tax=Acidithiobacillus TaxID=119977 RepID=UPI001C066954|nr:hypothetical protein [Acidithiobacillus ferrooxidans]MBU2807129.1 hypothetical protein [Acidithiobacillus ferrooxidans F221]
MRRGKGGLQLVVMNKNRGHLALAREKPALHLVPLANTRAAEIDEQYRDDEDNYWAFRAWFSWPIPPLVLH